QVDDGAPDAPVRLGFAPANDADAWYLHHLLADGFGAELLRTYAMSKRFAARTDGHDEAPTYMVLGDRPGPDRPYEVDVPFWRAKLPATSLCRKRPIPSARATSSSSRSWRRSGGRRAPSTTAMSCAGCPVTRACAA